MSKFFSPTGNKTMCIQLPGYFWIGISMLVEGNGKSSGSAVVGIIIGILPTDLYALQPYIFFQVFRCL